MVIKYYIISETCLGATRRRGQGTKEVPENSSRVYQSRPIEPPAEQAQGQRA